MAKVEKKNLDTPDEMRTLEFCRYTLLMKSNLIV